MENKIIGVSKVVLKVVSDDGSSSETTVYMPTEISADIADQMWNWKKEWQVSFKDAQDYFVAENNFSEKLKNKL